MEREGDHGLCDVVTFLFPTAQGPPHKPGAFMHHDYRNGRSYFKLFSLQEDGFVKFGEGEPHGSWKCEDDGDLVVNWHCHGHADKIKNHRYHKLPNAHAWRLAYCDGCSIKDVTFLVPISDH